MTRRRFTAALMVAAVACVLYVPLAAADDPPVTVPTPTTPAPPPDPAPPPAQPKPPQTHHTTPHTTPPRSVTPPRPVTHAPTTVQPTYTPPPATPTHVSHVRPHRAVTHVKVAKKRVVHKPKQTRPAVKPAPKPKTTPAVVTKSPRGGATLAASATRTENSDWLRWFLLLVAATGLMAVSIAAVVGNGRVVPVAVRRRRPPVRDVMAELVAAPPLLKAPTRRAPSRPAPPPPAAPEVEAEEPLPVAPPPPPPPPAPEPEAVAPAEAEPVAAPTEELCEILVWRGYSKARFYARLDIEHDGDEFAVAESPTFRFRGNGTPDGTTAAKEAHEALVAKLVAKGWEPEGTSGPWYAVRFRRPLPSVEHS